MIHGKARSLSTMVDITSQDKKVFESLTSPDDELPVTMVQDRQTAERVVQQLKALGPDHIHACDTEVADIDLKKQGPVGNGSVTCLSIFSGPDIDFGNGPRIWVDNLDRAEGTLDCMREFLEDPAIKKVWHNYSFDRHVIYNHQIDVQGLGGDTMHMSRLWNTARTHRGGYSLEALTADLLEKRKKPMKEIFGFPKLKKDGSAGKELLLPSIRELQRSPDSRTRWIRYSTYDAESTWYLHQVRSTYVNLSFRSTRAGLESKRGNYRLKPANRTDVIVAETKVAANALVSQQRIGPSIHV